MTTSNKTRRFAFALVLALLLTAVLFTTNTALAAGEIGLDQAKEIALLHAGFSKGEVTFKKAKLDYDDGTAEYEIDFTKGSYRYAYDIEAMTGDIREYSRKITKTTRNSSSASSYIGVEKAKAAALEHAGLKAGEVTFTKEKLDKGRTSEYDIEFYTNSTKYEYDIDAASGAVNEFTHKAFVQSATAAGGATPSKWQASSDSAIGIDKAKELALQHAGLSASQVKFTKAKLDRDDGVMVYDIEFLKDRVEYEYEINASTGAVLEYDIDFD